MENNEVDFYLVGQRHAKDGLAALKKMAKEYEERYGAQAREDFETGIASVIPQYANFFIASSELEQMVTPEGATTNYGVDNTRNNSYFGGTGTGVQYKENGDFNPPHIK